jgi:hypothetical protein
MTSRIIHKNKNTLNLLERFPRSNRKYLPSNKNCKDLVIYGLNLSSTVNYPPYTSIVRYMTKIPGHLYPLLVGLIISDGWLQINKVGNTRFALKQSIDKLEFLLHIFNQLSYFCSAYPYIVSTKLNGKIFKEISFSTRTYPCLTELYEMFYVNNIKRVPLNLYEFLTFETLAIWICCDGTKAHKGIILQTQSFTIREVTFIISILIYKFDLKCSIHMQRNQPTIFISSQSMIRIQPFILPYFCHSMRYKLHI